MYNNVKGTKFREPLCVRLIIFGIMLGKSLGRGGPAESHSCGTAQGSATVACLKRILSTQIILRFFRCLQPPW